MLERFTERARSTVQGAQAEARALGHRYIGTEHLLLALLKQDAGVAPGVLAAIGLTYDRAQARVAELTAAGLLGPQDAEALEAIGIDLDAVRAKIEEAFGEGALSPARPPARRGLFGRRGDGPVLRAPFTARAKKVLELAVREAVRLHSGFIGTEHLLLGLIREGHGLAARVLTDEGIELEALQAATLAATARAA